MTMAPLFSILTGGLLAISPSVPSLVVRRAFMPFSSTPWHHGEAACLADMFQNDPGGYGMASARIDAVAAVSKIIGPILGGSITMTFAPAPTSAEVISCSATDLPEPDLPNTATLWLPAVFSKGAQKKG